MDFSLTTLFVLPNGSLAADGFKRENLKPGQFGVFNSRYKAVSGAVEANKSPYVVFGQGRIENVPGLTHKYSDKVSKGSLIEWYKTTANPVAKNQITYVGFDGVDETKSIGVGCNEQVSLTVRARSSYIDTAFAYGLTRTVTFTTPCCDDCNGSCDNVDPRIVANAWAKMINEEPRLSKYVTATPVSECTVPATPATVINTITYCLSVTDNGDDAALLAIQTQYPNDTVTRTERDGSLSTYQVEKLATDPAPQNAVLSSPVKLAVCNTCPSGYTFVEDRKRIIVEGAAFGPFATESEKQTLADNLAAQVFPPAFFDGATQINSGTDVFTIPTHGFVTGEAVVFTEGAVPVPGLTSLETYYIIKVTDNTFSLAATKNNALAGIKINVTATAAATHYFTPKITATFLESNGAVAKILISYDSLRSAVIVDPSHQLIVTNISDEEALCIPPAGAVSAWSSCDTGFKVQRVLTLTLANDCNSQVTLGELQALYPSATVALVESQNCNSKYSLTQTSETSHETCNFKTPAKYPQVQAYKGLDWTEVSAPLTGSQCVAGVKIEGKPLDKYGNPCDPIAFPHEWDQLTFEVFAYKGAATSQDDIVFDRCDSIPVSTVRKSTVATGSGEEIFMLEKRYHSYQTTLKHIFHNSAWNGGFVRYSEPTKFYDTYVLKFGSPDLTNWSNESRQDETVIIAVPTGTGSELESFLLGYFGQEKFTAGVL